jgi:NAD(P)-dependent dehydrogenase (short-subunit alcohol dehydrogenase family)
MIMQAATNGASPVLVVTGGGRGIGAAVSLAAAEQGYAVCVNYRSNASEAEAVAAKIKQKGGRAIAVKADIGDENDVVRLFETVDRDLGRVTALANNAGIVGDRGGVDAISGATIAAVMQTNVVGAFLCAREALKRMLPAHGGNGGAIVNVSSVAARLGGAGRTVHYAASKGAMNTFTVGLAREVADQRVRVNAVAPGIIDTEIQEAGWLDKVMTAIPMRRAGTAAEVAAVVLWLLSEEAKYVSGAIIDVSGAR